MEKILEKNRDYCLEKSKTMLGELRVLSVMFWLIYFDFFLKITNYLFERLFSKVYGVAIVDLNIFKYI